MDTHLRAALHWIDGTIAVFLFSVLAFGAFCLALSQSHLSQDQGAGFMLIGCLVGGIWFLILLLAQGWAAFRAATALQSRHRFLWALAGTMPTFGLGVLALQRARLKQMQKSL